MGVGARAPSYAFFPRSRGKAHEGVHAPIFGGRDLALRRTRSDFNLDWRCRDYANNPFRSEFLVEQPAGLWLLAGGGILEPSRSYGAEPRRGRPRHSRRV